ncbi:MAG: copper chaperone [Cellvibrionaceae bacterium]
MSNGRLISAFAPYNLPFATFNRNKIMERKVFTVNEISCGHCTGAIKEEVSEIAGVSLVEADIDSKRVMVEFEAPANWDQIKAKLIEIEYPPADG